MKGSHGPFMAAWFNVTLTEEQKTFFLNHHGQVYGHPAKPHVSQVRIHCQKLGRTEEWTYLYKLSDGTLFEILRDGTVHIKKEEENDKEVCDIS